MFNVKRLLSTDYDVVSAQVFLYRCLCCYFYNLIHKDMDFFEFIILSRHEKRKTKNQKHK
jgi:hypothetical protein